MKGPGLRIDHEVRRLWACPECGRTTRRDGTVCHVHCTCGGENSPWMELIEAAPPRLPRARENLGDDPALS